MTDLDLARLCHANITAWAAHHGFRDMPTPIRAEQDRCFYRAPYLRAWVNGLIDAGTLRPGNFRNHGPTAVAGWREARGRTTAQVVKHYIDGHAVYEIDFDHWNPWDVRGILGHAFEVVVNKLAKRRTCPKAIAKELRKRGINDSV